MMPRRSEIGRDSAFVLGSKFLGLGFCCVSWGWSVSRAGSALLGLLPSTSEYGAASGFETLLSRDADAEAQLVQWDGAQVILGTWVCDHGAVVNIEEPKLISMIQIDFVHQSSDCLTAYHVFYLGIEESCSRR